MASFPRKEKTMAEVMAVCPTCTSPKGAKAFLRSGARGNGPIEDDGPEFENNCPDCGGIGDVTPKKKAEILSQRRHERAA